MITEFKKSCSADVDVLIYELVSEALKKRSYSAGIRWLDSIKPDLPHSFYGNAKEGINTLIRACIEDAKQKVRDIAMKQKPSGEDGN